MKKATMQVQRRRFTAIGPVALALAGSAACNAISGAGSIAFDGPCDCSNPICTSTHTCVETVPMGWTGPFALYDGPAAQNPGCGGYFPMSVYKGQRDISAPDAGCSPCTCDEPVGQKCWFSTVPHLDGTLYPITVQNAPCNDAETGTTIVDVPLDWDGSCYALNYTPGGMDCSEQPCHQRVTVDRLQVSGGSCTASTQAPILQPVAWDTVGEACAGAMPGAGCANMDETCLPIPQGPFHAGLCIMQEGEKSCPTTGVFSEQHIFYDAAMDTRGCSSCTCGAPMGGTCSATVTMYSDAMCTMNNLLATLHPTSTDEACADLTGNPRTQGRTAAFDPVSGGACPPSGGQPTGTTTPVDPTTFCCIPQGLPRP
ncbi:hypothetical protein [Sorangium sp. So ce131]|uniref:hypothetical protein n=1 Tax=Sorangium sp. So ce131 TaxID=3133282 RepID=UPI003F5DBED2